ncbi:MAG: alpha-galactosidase [Bacteroidales bacterium]|nr:alpha-galactosidase [Bacteroidales bacterium]
MYKTLLSSILCIFSVSLLSAASTVSYDKNNRRFILENNFVKRIISVYDSGISSTSYIIKENNYEMTREASKEFSFCLNNRLFCGNKDFIFSDYQIWEEDGKSRLSIVLNNPDCKVHVLYEIYDSHPVIRKNVTITNLSSYTCTLSDLFWEQLTMDPLGGKDLKGYFGSYLFTTPYAGGKHDPAVLLNGDKASILLGNEAPGILKYTGLYTTGQNELTIGMNQRNSDYPFVYTLNANSSFQSPSGFILSTINKPDFISFDYDLADFVREQLPVRLYQKKESPRFLYNTWMPFKYSINDTLLYQLADDVSDTGADYFAIDDGWQTYYGDWDVDLKKFPQGLKPVFDYIRSKGMKPGIWFAPTSLDARCKVYKDFSDCTVTDKNGEPSNLHGWLNNYPAYTMDITNPKWYNYVLSKLKSLIVDNGIEYVKIDLSVVKSAYVTQPERSGSYKITENSSGREAYLYKGYEQLAKLSSDLYTIFPDLIIDYTYELWGDHHAIDYFLIQHADLDWISNFNAYSSKGMQEVRNLCRQRGRVIPSSSMLVGNMCFDAPESLTAFISGFGSTPLMLGDARQLSKKQKESFKFYAEWFKKMQNLYNIMEYYQTGGLFNDVNEGSWDGFARFNTSLSGGILCFFRNHSVEPYRITRVPFIDPSKEYCLKDVSGKEIGRYKGIQLQEDGLPVSIKDPNGFIVIEISAM